MQGRKTEIRTDLYSADELRAMAKGDAAPRTIKRLLAIANALDGMTFTDAARAAGLERQALGDAVKRYNVEGVAGLKDRPRSGRPRKLGAAEEASLAALIVAGPDPEIDGLSAYTLDDLCLLVQTRFNQTYTDRGMSRLIKRLGFSRQKARPHHPNKDEAAQAAFKGGSVNG
jgi:transposase